MASIGVPCIVRPPKIGHTKTHQNFDNPPYVPDVTYTLTHKRAISSRNS